MRAALPLSALLHAALLAALLPRPPGRGAPDAVPPIAVELLVVSSAGGDPAPVPSEPQQAVAAPEPPQAGDGAAPAPAVPSPAQPAPAPTVNLGNAGAALADLAAFSDDVVPPGPDDRHPNLPPAYPAEAMRRRLQGSVHLLIHVAANGVPALVEVAGSSGYAVLDRAAREAVERWRFTPAQRGGGPVPYDVPLTINFVGR